MSLFKIASFLVLAVVLMETEAKIPSYIQVCKRNDPKLDQCIINSIKHLMPKLKKGIPELEVPGLEPLHLPELVISRGGAFRAVGSDIRVHGASNFEILKFRPDVNNNAFYATVRFPSLKFNAIYDVDARIVIPIKGKGPLSANASDIEGNGVLKGHKVTKEGKTFLVFDKLDLKLKMKTYSIRFDNLFNGDKSLGEAVNMAMNENKKQLMNMLRPRAEAITSQVLLDIANKITSHFEYEELFPPK